MLALLLRFWQPLVGLIAAGVILWAVDDYGDRREAVADARWQERYAEAERRAAAAEGRARAISAASEATRADLEKRIDELTRENEAALRGAAERIAGLLRERARRPSACDVPPVAGSTAPDAGEPESDRRAREAGERIARVGADCRHDAELLRLWREWYERESALRR